MKRVVVIADLHCGHRAGLTPPDWQYSKHAKSETERKFAEHQEHTWKWYYQQVQELKPIDVLLVNGDAIDGKGNLSGGTELITSDRAQQIVMAKECIEPWEAPIIIMTYGTAYHTGKEEDWETMLARELDATITNHKALDIEGTIIDIRHFVSRSIIPHGRYTPVVREKLWNLIWADAKGLAKADIFIRSHVHYYLFAQDSNTTYIVTPALQGPGSKFGTRICSGIVDVGMGYIDFDNGGFCWNRRLLNMTPLVDAPLAL